MYLFDCCLPLQALIAEQYKSNRPVPRDKGLRINVEQGEGLAELTREVYFCSSTPRTKECGFWWLGLVRVVISLQNI